MIFTAGISDSVQLPLIDSNHHTNNYGDCNTPASGLWNPIASSLQNSKRALVTHSDEATQSKLQYHAALERYKVTYILEQEKSGSVEVTVTQVACYQ